MRHINKFNIDWQLVRVDARSIKDVDQKIAFVKQFLQENASKENYGRVKNWARMTAMGYRPQHLKVKFNVFLSYIDTLTYDQQDTDCKNFSKYSLDELIRVHDDLNKRKYGFQIDKVPLSHIDFMNDLKSYLGLPIPSHYKVG